MGNNFCGSCCSGRDSEKKVSSDLKAAMNTLKFIKVETEKIDEEFSPSFASPSHSEKEYSSDNEESYQTKSKPFAYSHSPQIDPDKLVREGPMLNRKASMLPVQRQPTMGYWFDQME